VRDVTLRLSTKEGGSAVEAFSGTPCAQMQMQI